MRTNLLLAAGCCALLSVAWKERDAAKTTVPAVPPHPAKTAVEVADRLDSLLQPRFLERGEVFGVERIILPLSAHALTYRDANGQLGRQLLYALIGRDSKEKTLLAEADAPQKDYVVGFLHGANTLGKLNEKKTAFGRASLTDRFEPFVMREKGANASYSAINNNFAAWMQETFSTFDKSLAASDAKAQKGEKTTDSAGAWVLALRPVKAQASCLQCHGKAKTGDTLGVMFYAVKK